MNPGLDSLLMPWKMAKVGGQADNFQLLAELQPRSGSPDHLRISSTIYLEFFSNREISVREKIDSRFEICLISWYIQSYIHDTKLYYQLKVNSEISVRRIFRSLTYLLLPVAESSIDRNEIYFNSNYFPYIYMHASACVI